MGLAIAWTFVLVPWDFIVGRGAVFQHGEMAWQLAGWWRIATDQGVWRYW